MVSTTSTTTVVSKKKKVKKPKRGTTILFHWMLLVWTLVVGDTAIFGTTTKHSRMMAMVDATATRRTSTQQRRTSSSTGSIPQGGTQYPHFIALNETMTCVGDVHSTPFNNAVRGVNLGGWMVLEPWITPSLFYQFLNQPEGQVGIDSYTFCQVLGGKIANQQLRAHWETWVTQDLIQQLKESGAVNSLRLPIGDYQFIPYGPYRTFCFCCCCCCCFLFCVL